MPRLVRRRPLAERIKSYLNPLDFLLWLSEEIDSNDWDDFQRSYATPLGLALNLVFVIARSNSQNRQRWDDDVFGDGDGGSGWLSWFATFVVHLLTLFSISNAFYTFYRKRHYRLYEASVDVPPSTPSARRVRVDSSPLSSSPLRFLSHILAAETAENRAHPDATRDVWELAVWDPLPLCLRMSCLLSPGHVLVYMLFLPTLPSDPRPSTTVFTTIFIGCILSLQLFTLQASFSQQSKDTAIIHKEVQHEYDTKFVHPRMNPVVRDVGIQCDADYSTSKHVTEVDTYTPTTIINKGFQTHPNPNYSKHVDPDGVSDIPQRPDPRNILSPLNPAFQTPAVYNRQGGSTPFRPSTGMRQPHFRPNPGADGGSLGVYSHADSPLKKSASANVLRSSNAGRDGTGRQGAAIKREGSPLKRSSVPGGMTGLPQGQRFAHLGVGTPNRRESGYF